MWKLKLWNHAKKLWGSWGWIKGLGDKTFPTSLREETLFYYYHHNPGGVINYMSFKKNYSFIFRGKGRGKDRERNIKVWFPLVCPLLRSWPATQACALTGNWTSDSLIHRPALNPLSHTSQGYKSFLIGEQNYTWSKGYSSDTLTNL